MTYAGETSTYEGVLPLERAGRTELQILAMQPGAANIGMVKRLMKVKH